MLILTQEESLGKQAVAWAKAQSVKHERKGMRIYLAARYSRQAEMAEVAARLKAMGHTVTSRWVRGDHLCNDQQLLDDPGRAARFANDDLDDIDAADALVLFTDPVRTPTRGGKLVEAGYAMALGLQLFRVGPPENVFEQLPQWRAMADADALCAYLGKVRA